jgi:glycosyltransferase involved in cell wall biosynthesis
MINNKKVVVVLPAFNAAKTLEKTYLEIPLDIVDEVVITDDASIDNTVEVAKRIGIKHVLQHDVNKGYGGNQKTCYDYALTLNADIIIMLHPDYQYTPKLIRAITSIIAEDVYEVVLASRILGGGALKGGMPLYKYFFNRVMTLVQNILMGIKNYQNIIRVTELLLPRLYVVFPIIKTVMILFLIISFWLNYVMLDMKLQR